MIKTSAITSILYISITVNSECPDKPKLKILSPINQIENVELGSNGKNITWYYFDKPTSLKMECQASKPIEVTVDGVGVIHLLLYV